MNILYIANADRLYGANRSMLDIIESLQGRHQIYVVAPKEGELTRALRKKKVPYIVLEYYPDIYGAGEKRWDISQIAANLSAIGKIIERIKKYRIDVVHTNSITHVSGALSAFLAGVPHVWHIREMLSAHYDKKFVWPHLLRFLLRRSSCIICISYAVRRYYEEECRGGHVCVLHNGLHCEDYIFDRNGLYFPEKELRILVCGVITEGKHQLEAVRTIHKLKKEGIPASLKIVGMAADRKYYEKIKRYIQKNGLTGQITLLPHQKDLRNIRKNTDIALNCSRNEALGRVTIEGMLGGCLVIGAEDGGTAEIIQDGETGFLYPAGNVGALLSILRKVHQNRQGMIPVIQNGQRYAKAHFNIEEYSKKIECIYEQAIREKRKKHGESTCMGNRKLLQQKKKDNS